MSNPVPHQPLSFGRSKKQITRKTNLLQHKKGPSSSNSISHSKKKISTKPLFASPPKNTNFHHCQNNQTNQTKRSKQKNGDCGTFSKKHSQCSKTLNSHSSSLSIMQQLQTKSELDERAKSSKKSVSRRKKIDLCELDGKVRKLSENTNEVMRMFEQLKCEHGKEQKLMEMVLSGKELHRYKKILAVEQAEYLMAVLKDTAE